MIKTDKIGRVTANTTGLKLLNHKLWKRSCLGYFLLICLYSLLLFPVAESTVCASVGGEYKVSNVSGQELEKPRPVFTRNGEEISAKFIPRAKSTSVILNFKVTKGGKLLDVKGMDFEKADRPEVDIKNYKSALFIVEVGEVSPVGSDATVAISSDFFSSGTQYRIFNEKLPTPWMNSECQNISTTNRVRDLIVTVKDGGPFDSDGEANGSITLVGGPRDSFWGYALGTLFIRFFGIFLVLGVLMAGMMLSGAIFSRMESKKIGKEPDATDKVDSDDIKFSSHDPKVVTESEEEEIVETEKLEEMADMDPVDDYEIAAAIATALHLYFESSQQLSNNTSSSNSDQSHLPTEAKSVSVRPTVQANANTWSNDGRSQMMRERLQTYNRGNR